MKKELKGGHGTLQAQNAFLQMRKGKKKTKNEVTSIISRVRNTKGVTPWLKDNIYCLHLIPPLLHEMFTQNFGKTGIILTIASFPALSINYQCNMHSVVQGQSPCCQAPGARILEWVLSTLTYLWEKNAQETSAFQDEGSSFSQLKGVKALSNFKVTQDLIRKTGDQNGYMMGQISHFHNGLKLRVSEGSPAPKTWFPQKTETVDSKTVDNRGLL